MYLYSAMAGLSGLERATLHGCRKSAGLGESVVDIVASAAVGVVVAAAVGVAATAVHTDSAAAVAAGIEMSESEEGQSPRKRQAAAAAVVVLQVAATAAAVVDPRIALQVPLARVGID